MRFLADMGVSGRVIEWLRSQGYDAVHLREQGLHRAKDPEVLSKAVAEERVLLTFDLDFGEIVALGPRDHSVRVIVFRLRDTRPTHVIARLADVLTQSTNVLRRGAVIVVEDARHRVRTLPMGED